MSAADLRTSRDCRASPSYFQTKFEWRFSRPVRSGWERSGRPNRVRKDMRNRHAEGIRSTGRNPGRRWNVRYLRGARLSTDSHCMG